MKALTSRATGYENNPGNLPPPSFNIRDRNKLNELGLEIKKIYIPNGKKWQDLLGYAIAVSYFTFIIIDRKPNIYLILVQYSLFLIEQ